MGGSTELNRRLMAAKVQSTNEKFTVISIASIWESTLRALHYHANIGMIGRPFGISSDGERFLMLKDFLDENVDWAPERIYVTQNWTEELKRLVPTSKQ